MSDTLTGKIILVVDDEADLRELLREELSSHGASVLEAENGTIALDICRSNRLDAVITDIRMPGGDGIELLKKLTDEFDERAPDVFFVTGYTDLSPKTALALGAKGVFQKPFSLKKLCQILIKHLA